MVKHRSIFGIVCFLAVVALPIIAADVVRADKEPDLPRFHQVLIFNDTGRVARFPTRSHRIALRCEMLNKNREWRTVADMEAPLAFEKNASMLPGEVWLFLVRDFAGNELSTVRLALDGFGGTIYSERFEATINPSATAETDRFTCHLARLRMQPPCRESVQTVLAPARKSQGY